MASGEAVEEEAARRTEERGIARSEQGVDLACMGHVERCIVASTSIFPILMQILEWLHLVPLSHSALAVQQVGALRARIDLGFWDCTSSTHISLLRSKSSGLERIA